MKKAYFFFIIYSVSVTLTFAQTLKVLDKNIKEPDCQGRKNGSITYEVEGGIPPYSFLWNNGSFEQNLENIGAGKYAVTIGDSSNPPSISIDSFELKDPFLYSHFECDKVPGTPKGENAVFILDSFSQHFTFPLKVDSKYGGDPLFGEPININYASYFNIDPKQCKKNKDYCNFYKEYGYLYSASFFGKEKFTFTVHSFNSNCINSYVINLPLEKDQPKFSITTIPDRLIVPKGVILDTTLTFIKNNSTIPLLEIHWYKVDPKKLTKKFDYNKYYKYKYKCSPCDSIKIQAETPVVYRVYTISRFYCESFQDIYILSENEKETLPAYFPTAFSPNDDGINDNFTVFSDEKVEQIEELIIFDRWGGEIFKTSNIPVSDESKGWNGKTPNNELLPQGNYTYFCRLRLKDGTEKSIKGEVMLMR